MISSLIQYPLNHPLQVCVAVVIIVLIKFVYLFYTLLTNRGPNPFEKNAMRPPTELVIDHKARDKVIKQSFSEFKVPKELDAIVIGSGIGGLSTAAILAKVGKKVLVLEQHDQAGGSCHTYVDKGYEFDVGVHYVGRDEQGSLTTLMVDQLFEGQLRWASMGQYLEEVTLGKGKDQTSYLIPKGEENWRNKMYELFPDEKKAIDQYLTAVKVACSPEATFPIVKCLPLSMVRWLLATGLPQRFFGFFVYGRKTVVEVVNQLTTNQRLRDLLIYAFPTYGASPDSASFTMHALVTAHYQNGSYFPVGGDSEIAFQLTQIIERSGGRVLVKAKVDEILVDKAGHVSGVKVTKGAVESTLNCSTVISDAGVSNTFLKLLPKEVASKTPHHALLESGKLAPGWACLSIFVGLRGMKEDLGLPPHNLWIASGDDLASQLEKFSALSAEDAAESPNPMVFAAFTSARDPSYNQRHPDRSAGVVIGLVKYEWFNEWKDKPTNRRGLDYDVTKRKFGQQIWQQVIDIYPHLKEKVDYMTFGSPLSSQHYLSSSAGEFTGLAHTTQRFDPQVFSTLRPEVTEVPGLYITGQDATTSGLTGGMYAGLFTAGKILNRFLVLDLINLARSLSAGKKA